MFADLTVQIGYLARVKPTIYTIGDHTGPWHKPCHPQFKYEHGTTLNDTEDANANANSQINAHETAEHVDHQPSAQSDHPQPTASGSDEPVHPLPVNFEPGRSGSTAPLVVNPFCMMSQPWQICLQYLSWKVVDHLELSYRTPKQLNEIIDDKLPGHPPFQCHEIVMAGEHLQFYFCDILQSIRSLFGDPEFHVTWCSPRAHYANSEQSSHVYSEMHTGDWWWAVQLTLFHGKVTYPVYLTIGNILKAICRKPTHQAIKTGVDMLSGDEIWHHCHPILAVFVGDYPKQALVTCTYQDGDIHMFHSACHKADLKPVFHSLWEALPLVNIFISITPDVLHQMLQGVMKHRSCGCPAPLALQLLMRTASLCL
ncbi:hypothetical protein EI94DRAFT_1695856 [Lactarius quietus]|nr:hypothetical protein EI94DRAFT_1695856 [Lactarius quietus]